MSVPLQVIVADPELGRLALGEGAWVFVWDDQPEVGARAARHARGILEATGARGEGGLARLVVGGARGEIEGALTGGPTPVATLRVGLEGDGLVVPADVGPRALGRADRVVIARHLAGWIADVATGPSARDGLAHLQAAIGERAFGLAAVARFPIERLERQLVRRALAGVATRLQALVRAGGDTTLATTFDLDGIEVDRGAADGLGWRVGDEGPSLARRLAAEALAAADEVATQVRAEVVRLFAQQGLAGLEGARAMVAELARRVADAGLDEAVAPVMSGPVAPRRAALDAAEAAAARLAAPTHGLWPLEAAGALGGATVGALALGPLLPALEQVPGGGAGLAAGVGLGLWALAAGVTRLGQHASRRHTERALEAAREGHAVAWRDGARAWLGPIAALAERRARLRLARALADEGRALDAVAAELEALKRAGQRPVGGEAEATTTLATTIDLEAAAAVLALPLEPLVARADAEVRRPDWRDGRPLLAAEGLEASARASHTRAGWSAATGLPLDARADLVAALAEPVAAGLDALRGELARWVPEGLPVRRLVSTPGALATATPAGARGDERVACRRDLWVVALWRSA